jgi:hypothetical protein
MTGYQLKSVKARNRLSKSTFVWGLAMAFRVTVVSLFAFGCLYLFGFDEKLNATLKAFALAFFYSDLFWPVVLIAGFAFMVVISYLDYV